VRTLDDLARVNALPGDYSALGEQLEAIRHVRRGLPDDVLLIETVFSPLSVLTYLSADPQAVQTMMAHDPGAVTTALDAITRTFEDFVPRALHAGADGIYFATVHWATSERGWTPEEYREFALPFDRRVLAQAKGAPFNVLHVCKPKNLLFELSDYPVQAFSYDATDPSNPTLDQALARVSGAVMGGISHEGALQSGVEAVTAEVRRGFEQTGGRRWLVAPGCSIPPRTPAVHLESVRAAVDAMSSDAASPSHASRRAIPP
jgi:uroporphyrinogen decarboxylase